MTSSNPEQPTATVTALDVLRQAKVGLDDVQYISESEPITVALLRMVDVPCGSVVVRDNSGRIVGFVTPRDVLRAIVKLGRPSADASSADSSSADDAAEPRGWNVPVSQIMTPSKDLVYLSPTDTLEEARSLMAVSGKRNVPVLSGSTLLGVINPKDIARFIHLSTGDHSAKTDYVSTVMPRKGMPLGTRLRKEIEFSPDGLCALDSAVCTLPHPSKADTGGEDAFVLGPHMVGVADGVGSWWEEGIDPAAYSRALMYASRTSCSLMKREKELHPQHVLLEAWHVLKRSSLVGSSTVCLVALHPHKAELRAANVGDSGFLILRRHGVRQQSTAPLGTLDAFGVAAAGDQRSFHIAFRSPQQLRSFNMPYQLGCAPDSGEGPDPRFETPNDADVVRVPVRGGDILLLATDGLFDNMNEEQVLDVIESALDATPQEQANLLARRAQELSLDRDTDSPFAVLAKDNDIMWGGGRPDDITVIVSHIEWVSDSSSDSHRSFTAYSGPGEPPAVVRQLMESQAGDQSVSATAAEWD